jgi:ribonuclease G
MQKKQLIINADYSHTRIALLEDGRLAELFYEFAGSGPEVGSIYKGIVSRVLPGLNSAFVDIGTEKAAFLFASEVLVPPQVQAAYAERSASTPAPSATIPISHLLSEGQQVVVQISKTALGSKGPRATMQITLPGRYLVYLPYTPHIGVSRRLEDEVEKSRLRELIAGLLPAGGAAGVIIRTAAQGVSAELLQRDFAYLRSVANGLASNLAACKAPSLVFRDLDLLQKTVRDRYSDEIVEVVVDERDAYFRVENFRREVLPEVQGNIVWYRGEAPIFEAYGIETEIARALGARVNLPSGGYLIIEQTEALTSFDVNTGSFVGKANAEDTIFITNQEAVIKIAEQLRLRNIGGIIVVDFIDMVAPASREQLYLALLEQLKHDSARTQVLPFSEFGLVQITRKRSSASLEKLLMSPCAHCEGTGKVKKDFKRATST